MFANEVIGFINDSPTPFHAVSNIKKILDDNGFVEVYEGGREEIRFGEKYYVTRNGSAIIAFVMPEGIPSSMSIVASHCDSPCFKLKPEPVICVEKNYLLLDTEKYGGLINSTWLDRPLSLAGRVFMDYGNKIVPKLVDFKDVRLVIPNLAIHMNPEINKGYQYNLQKELLPLLGMGNDRDSFDKMLKSACGDGRILGMDMFLYNGESGTIAGIDNELILSPRLDDLECVYASIDALINSDNKDKLCMCCVFDNEEVGSKSLQGADSDFLLMTVKKIAAGLNMDEQTFSGMLSRSMVVSADNAHALHPEYTEKADTNNRPVINEGIVIKKNSSLKYTTDGFSEAFFKKICKNAGIPVQMFANRSDIAGGSTLGNISISHMSVHTVDIGLPQLAMHSAMETAGVKDVTYLREALEEFYNAKYAIDKDIVEIL